MVEWLKGRWDAVHAFLARRLRSLLLVGVPAVGLLIGGYYYLSGGRIVSTDNAYVRSDKVSVSADISGRVVQVNVREFQHVRPGEVLFRLDPEPFRIAQAQAEAQLASARRDIESLRATYHARQADLMHREGTIAFLRKEYERQKGLVERALVPQSQLDEAAHNLESATLQAAAIRQESARALNELGGRPNIPTDEHPKVRQAMALLEQAELNLRRTVVRASIEGQVGPTTLQPGEYVQTGVSVFSVVAADPWVEANLKETELTHTRVGQAAKITVDAYPGYTWSATVVSISPATGAEFSLLPPQNATGNWVKVVQRVPVKLKIEPRPGMPPLRTGMSAVVEIDTGRERGLPELVRKALAWGRREAP
jgi:membrane fusion protein (multidrug efflux system)